MSISQLFLILVSLLTISALAYRIGRLASKKPTPPMPAQNLPASSVVVEDAPKLEIFSILDQTGSVVVQSSEVAGIPRYARRLSAESPSVRHAAQLAADVFKGAVNLPSRSINIVFRADVQAGLKDGTYRLMKTTAGETLADAVDTTGKIVAKGRIVETGKLRQLASGGFQLASIVVAQAHLADIERSLQALRSDVKEILDDLEASNIANITGKSSYLSDLVKHIAQLPAVGELPVHFANSIQQIVAESHTLRDKLHEDIKALIRRVEKQADPDTFGTESVYKGLRGHVDKANQLLIRHAKLSQLMAILNYAVAFIDPIGKQFFRADMKAALWNELCGGLANQLAGKAEQYLSNAQFNSEDTLTLRKKDVVRDTSAFLLKSTDQQLAFDNAMAALIEDNERYFGKDAETHITLSFDDNGLIKEAAVL